MWVVYFLLYKFVIAVASATHNYGCVALYMKQNIFYYYIIVNLLFRVGHSDDNN